MLRYTSNVANRAPIWRRRLTMLLVLCLLSMGAVGVAMGAAAKQKSFPTPEEGVQALIEAAQRHDTTTLLAILGPEAKSILSTGDPVPIGKAVSISSSRTKRHIRWCSRGTRRRCCRSGKTSGLSHPARQGQRRLALRHAGGQGRDPQAAHRTQRARRHPGVPGLCRRATRILRAQSPERYATAVCAPKFISTKGKRDGLYWETSANEPPSPWGPLVARARREGYKRAAGKPVPYHGYYYKMLTRQGPDAPGGAYDYMVRGKMIGGFALVAYPAQYGSSGIMTFMVNHDGVVYQKDFGPNTAATAQSMTKFNPDKTWKQLSLSDQG